MFGHLHGPDLLLDALCVSIVLVNDCQLLSIGHLLAWRCRREGYLSLLILSVTAGTLLARN